MSSIRTRTRLDGSTYVQVLWRDVDGRQRSRALVDQEHAERYREVLDLAGETAAEADATRESHSEYTVSSFVEQHIENRSRITEGTRFEYLKMWARTFGPILGEVPLDVLDRDMVSKAVTRLATEPRRNHEPLSHKSIKNARDLLATVLADAVDQGLITRNPTKGVGIPRVRADDADDMRILTMEEWARVEPEIPTYWLAILRLLVGTGMRVNEATALRVSSVNLAAPSLRVTRGWKRDKSGWKIGPPKSPKSVRTIELDPVFAEILEPYVTGRQADELLFTSRAGNRVHDGNLRSRVWQPACVRAGIIPPPTLHALRHTHVAWLIEAGEDFAVIQARLGHESIKTTIDVYGHLMPDTRRRAATVAARAFGERMPAITSA